jgi:hypothetical protein
LAVENCQQVAGNQAKGSITLAGCLIWPVAALRHQSLQSRAAGGAKQVGPDLTLLERHDEDAVRPARQRTGEVGLAQGQRQRGQVVAIERGDVEGVELFPSCLG